ncbi:unnamed protein product [Protopolystoma xenopodis]|uniref:Uncharacterized protein n=1 Tax=Protopolystoma xenopodis TaxID=117903 RepID=A0A3S5CHQ8_9PLAT|nr:unnamed protein product [Protopolystoma xenopodis]
MLASDGLAGEQTLDEALLPPLSLHLVSQPCFDQEGVNSPVAEPNWRLEPAGMSLTEVCEECYSAYLARRDAFSNARIRVRLVTSRDAAFGQASPSITTPPVPASQKCQPLESCSLTQPTPEDELGSAGQLGLDEQTSNQEVQISPVISTVSISFSL